MKMSVGWKHYNTIKKIYNRTKYHDYFNFTCYNIQHYMKAK